MKSILKFLSDRAGQSSSMRLVFVVCTFGIVFCVLSVWTYVSLKTLAVADLPAGIVAFAIGVIGTLVGVKAYQKKIEDTTTEQLGPAKVEDEPKVEG